MSNTFSKQPVVETKTPDIRLFYPAGRLEPKDKWSAFYAFAQAFDAQACSHIVALGQRYELEDGSVRTGGAPLAGMEDNRLQFRDCRIRWLPCEALTADLFRALAEMATVANDEVWRADISGFIEKLQFTEYDQPGAHYHWHSDTGGGIASLRKLSFSLQLSPADTYDGGDLEFTQPIADDVKRMFRQQGTAIVFPSYLTHRVTPITRGKRISLVGWIAGPPYR